MNEFKVFAANENAQAITGVLYDALCDIGLEEGTPQITALTNGALRVQSLMSNALGKLIEDAGENAIADNDTDALKEALKIAIERVSRDSVSLTPNVYLTDVDLDTYNDKTSNTNLGYGTPLPKVIQEGSYLRILPSGLYILHLRIAKELMGISEYNLLENLPQEYRPSGDITAVGIFPGADSGYNEVSMGHWICYAAEPTTTRPAVYVACGSLMDGVQDYLEVHFVGYKA